jgi:hypothetical protein
MVILFGSKILASLIAYSHHQRSHLTQKANKGQKRKNKIT